MAAGDSVLVALIWKARHRVMGDFCAMHAISAEDAIAYQPRTPAEREAFDRMRARRIVREAIKGHYWLDHRAYQAETDAWRRRAIPITVFACVVIALALMIAANLINRS